MCCALKVIDKLKEGFPLFCHDLNFITLRYIPIHFLYLYVRVYPRYYNGPFNSLSWQEALGTTTYQRQLIIRQQNCVSSNSL